jgi:hypothetical protein
MKCEDRFEMLFRYSEGDLGPREALELETHLNDCDACRSRLAKLRGMESCVRRSLAQRPPSPDLSRSVMRAVTREDKPQRRGWMWMWKHASAYVAVGMLLGGFMRPHVLPEQPTVIATMTPSVTLPGIIQSMNKPKPQPPTQAEAKHARFRPCGCPILTAKCSGCRMDCSPKTRRSHRSKVSIPEKPITPTVAAPTNIALARTDKLSIEPKGLNDARLIISPDTEKSATP